MLAVILLVQGVGFVASVLNIIVKKEKFQDVFFLQKLKKITTDQLQGLWKVEEKGNNVFFDWSRGFVKDK